MLFTETWKAWGKGRTGETRCGGNTQGAQEGYQGLCRAGEGPGRAPTHLRRVRDLELGLRGGFDNHHHLLGGVHNAPEVLAGDVGCGVAGQGADTGTPSRTEPHMGNHRRRGSTAPSPPTPPDPARPRTEGYCWLAGSSVSSRSCTVHVWMRSSSCRSAACSSRSSFSSSRCWLEAPAAAWLPLQDTRGLSPPPWLSHAASTPHGHLHGHHRHCSERPPPRPRGRTATGCCSWTSW